MAISHAPTRREQYDEGCELYDALRPRRRRCGESAEGFLIASLAVLLALRIELQAYVLRKGIDPSRVGRSDGKVWLWPKSKRDGPPLVLRLIRVKCKSGSKKDGRGDKEIRKIEKREIWLLTDVMDSKELSRREARQLYEMRWPANEVGFGVWKHVLQGEKAFSRTPKQAEREGMLSLLGMMWLQVMATAAQKELGVPPGHVSVARAAQVWRKAARHCAAGRKTLRFREEMSEATVDTYRRRRSKVKRRWAERKDHSFATRPKLRRLTAAAKALGEKRLKGNVA